MVGARRNGGLHVQAIEVLDHAKDVIVANDLRIESDLDITRQWVYLHMGHTIQLGQLALHLAGHCGGAFDFGDRDPHTAATHQHLP